LAGALVEGHHGGPLAADVDQHALAVDQRRAGDAEGEVLGVELLERVHLPELPAGAGLEAGEDAGDAERADAVVADGWRGPRPGAEQGLEVATRVGRPPERLAVLGVEGDDFLLVLVLDLGVDEDPAAGDDGRAVALADGLLPEDLRRRLPGGDLLRRD